MAEAIGVASGLLALATFAFKASVSLYNTVQSFKGHAKVVRDLAEEIQALSAVLGPLAERIRATDDEALSALDLPLQICGKSCVDFEQEIIKCSSRSTGDRSSFRDWAKLRYMGDDIDGFRRLLAGYKQTINIALADANLRKATVTAESLESYKNLVEDATVDLKAHLERIDAKLDTAFEKSAAKSDITAAEQQLIKQEQLSTRRCLEICNQLSQHIDQVQEDLRTTGLSSGVDGSDTSSEAIFDSGLQECQQNLIDTAAKLEKHMQALMDRMVNRSKTSLNSEDTADMLRLRDEWEATFRGVKWCSQADQLIRQTTSDVENYATGDAVQFMVSTNGKVIHGKNRGLGWRTRQVGGYLSDDSLQQLSRDMMTVNVRTDGNNGNIAEENLQSSSEVIEDEQSNKEFKERFGTGFQLLPKRR